MARAEDPGVRHVGRYLLFGEIASGGMASVHYGRLDAPAGFSRTVAIKRLHPHYAKQPEFVAMFLDEARLASRVRHPNVVPTLDVVNVDDEVFLVMEYIEGESLRRLFKACVARDGRVPPKIAATIIAGVLHGLHAAHEAKSERAEPLGLVHRDVSPQNVLVGADGVARVLDFGVAKAAGRLQVTREGQLKGKLAYMAPEQLLGGEITRKADIYAASVVLWELLAGRRMYEAENEGALITQVLTSPVYPPSAFAPDVPRALDTITLRGLARDAALRWPTARAMALELEQSVGVVSHSQIGEWVEALAHAKLAARAARVHAIENANDGAAAAAALAQVAPMSTESSQPSLSQSAMVAAAAMARSATANIAVVGYPGAPAPRTGRALRLALALAGIAAVATFAIVLALPRTGTAPAASAANAAAPPPPSAATTEPPEPSAAPLPAPSASDEASGDDDDDATTEAAAASASAASSAAPAATTAPRVTRTKPPATAKPPAPAVDCNPPYVVDQKGHRHYKPSCL